MTDVEGKTPTKRKNLSNPQNKKGSAKKAKLDNINELQKGKSPKQKFNKNKKNSESENDSPKKLKPFPGTQATGGKNKKVEAKKKQVGTEGQKKRKGLFTKLENLVKSDDKRDALKAIEEKLKIIQGRGELTKTAKRKVRLLERLKRQAEGKPNLEQQQKAPHSKSESTKRRERKRNAKEASKETSIDKNQSNKAVQQANNVKINGKANKNQKVQNKKAAQKVILQKQVEEDEDDSDEDEDEAGLNLEEDESDSDDEVNVKQESEEEEEDDGESGDEEEEEEEEEEEDADEDKEEEESDEDEEEEDVLPPPKIERNTGSKEEPFDKKPKIESNIKKNTNDKKGVDLEQLKENNLVAKNQKRFVLFVGNIPYDTVKQDLIEHFKKSGEIKHVRIPTEKKTSKPRGFAYVELSNEDTYQKCLSMHHTFLKGRRINVLYTQGGKKKGEDKKKEIKAKNFKLHAMRKQGQLAGSKKQTQKRSFRRAKKSNMQKKSEGQQEVKLERN